MINEIVLVAMTIVQAPVIGNFYKEFYVVSYHSNYKNCRAEIVQLKKSDNNKFTTFYCLPVDKT